MSKGWWFKIPAEERLTNVVRAITKYLVNEEKSTRLYFTVQFWINKGNKVITGAVLVCPVCGTVFFSLPCLLQHLQRVHEYRVQSLTQHLIVKALETFDRPVRKGTIINRLKKMLNNAIFYNEFRHRMDNIIANLEKKGLVVVEDGYVRLVHYHEKANSTKKEI